MKNNFRFSFSLQKNSKIICFSNQSSHYFKKTDKSTRLVASVILVFFICWLPNHVSNFVHWLYPGQILSDDPASPATDPVRTENAIHMLTAVLGFSNRKMFEIFTINTHAVGVKYCLRCRYGRCAAILEFFLLVYKNRASKMKFFWCQGIFLHDFRFQKWLKK